MTGGGVIEEFGQTIISSFVVLTKRTGIVEVHDSGLSFFKNTFYIKNKCAY